MSTVPDEKPDAHPSTETLSGYLDGMLSREQARIVEEHLDRCPACRSDLQAVTSVLRSRRRTKWVRLGLPSAAVAAAVLLVLARGREASLEPVLRDTQPIAADAGRFEAVFPGSTIPVPIDSVVFRWRSASPDRGTLYRLTLTDERGDVLWTTETRDTTAVPEGTGRLSSGLRYLWYVDALLPGAVTATTGIRDFRIR